MTMTKVVSTAAAAIPSQSHQSFAFAAAAAPIQRERERERGGRRTRFFPPSVLRSRTRGLGRRPALGLALLTLEKVRGEEGIVEQSEKMESTARRAARHLGEFLVEISFTCGRGGGIDLIAQSTPAMF